MVLRPCLHDQGSAQTSEGDRTSAPEQSLLPAGVVRRASGVCWIPKDVTISIVKGLRSRGYMIGWDAYQWGVDELARLRDEGGSEERRRILGKSLMEMLRT